MRSSSAIRIQFEADMTHCHSQRAPGDKLKTKQYAASSTILVARPLILSCPCQVYLREMILILGPLPQLRRIRLVFCTHLIEKKPAVQISSISDIYLDALLTKRLLY